MAGGGRRELRILAGGLIARPGRTSFLFRPQSSLLGSGLKWFKRIKRTIVAIDYLNII